MKNRDLKKTLYLLDRYNMSSDNFKVNHILDENIIDPIIINCYLFEKQKIEFKNTLNDKQIIIAENKFSYTFCQKILDDKYFELRKIIFIRSKFHFIHGTSHNFILLDELYYTADYNNKIWNQFINTSSQKISLICKYMPEVDDFFEFKLTPMQKIIITLYEEECSMQEVVYCLNHHPEISKKYSANSIRKFVLDNTKFFLYWGILNKID